MEGVRGGDLGGNDQNPMFQNLKKEESIYGITENGS
jgi:hypothetical protein